MKSILYCLVVLLCFWTVNGNDDSLMHPLPLVNTRSGGISSKTAAESNTQYWLDKGKEFVQNQRNKIPNQKFAKNVIFFIGDGMSLATLAASRVYMKNGGEEASLSFEKFPYTGLSKTYCLDRIVPDSAATSTAYMSGVKTNYGMLGMNGQTKRGNCTDALNLAKRTQSIGEWFQKEGKQVGFVTTTRVTHASPAGLYSHSPDRNWENDDEIRKKCGPDSSIVDIAKQLVTGPVGEKLKVILGGGRREFLPQTEKNGKRTDGINLIRLWQDYGFVKKEKRVYVENKSQLEKINLNQTDKLLGLFETTHMKYHLESDKNKMPTLAEMTKTAIEMLSTNNDQGYFLFVEGGKIDLAHHKVQARLAFDETVEFSKAIELAKNLTDKNDDTLIVVSSDHSHTMSISGYPERKNDIFGAADKSEKDQMPYLTLSYGNGRAYETYFNVKKNKRYDPTTIDRNDNRAEFPSTIPINTETHGGEDVAVFASGPQAHLFTGVYEQNLLPHLMAFAANIEKK